jgi:predicted nucleic acid-binding protein
MVAAVCAWHERHAGAAAEIERRLAARERMATAAHALAESFAVLTRLPAPYRIAPADALAVLEGNFLRTARVASLDADGYKAMLRRAGSEGVAGGRVYDAVIAACALKARASTLLTFNAAHFAGLLPPAVRIVTPPPHA